MRLLRLLLLILLPVTVPAQNASKAADFIIDGNAGIAKTLTSQMFRTAFNGVFEAGAGGSVRVFGKFYAGLGYSITHFENNREIFVYYTVPPGQKTGGTSLSYNTRLTSHTGFINLGVSHYFSKIGFMHYALRSGYSYALYSNVSDTVALNKPYAEKEFYTPYLQPEVSANFIAEDHLSFGVFLSYTTLLYHFNPRAPQFFQFSEVRASSNRYVMSWFAIGFNFKVLLSKKKKA
jgi:hypothetical protein